jgi:two-component system cell cycle sensor histidine kinase/response regulator CckA
VVLVVEDEEQVRSLVVSQLSARGYAVLSAADGREALGVAERRTEHIDVLLADVVMPRMSGQELARLLVRSHPETSVIFMSGYAEEAVLSPGAPGEGDAFIGKPFDVDALCARIQVLLARNGRTRSGRSGEGPTCDFRHPG